jgi:site-specific DNA-cytosine methylase
MEVDAAAAQAVRERKRAREAGVRAAALAAKAARNARNLKNKRARLELAAPGALAARLAQLAALCAVKVVELAAGIGGAREALSQLPALMGAHWSFSHVHASDFDQGKVDGYNAAAAAAAPPAPPAVLADVTDKAFFTPELVASWGAVGLLVSSIPCTSFSPLGKRLGLAACAAFLAGLFRIVRLAKPKALVFECTSGLERDPLFEPKFLKPLAAAGYNCSYALVDARAWVGVARTRLFLVCFLEDAAAQARFDFPLGPDRRAVKLHSVILPAYRKGAPPGTAMAPLESYFRTAALRRRKAKAAASAAAAGGDAAKAKAAAGRLRQRDLSIAARAVGKLPFLRGRQHSRVVTFQFGRVNAIRTSRGVAPTLVKSGSGALMLRDAFGVRRLVGAEVAALHGYSAATVAALGRALSSNQVAAAVGDGFVVPVVRDVLRAALAAAWG